VTKQTRELRRLAEENFGWSTLRADQVRAMEHVLAGHDVLAVLPTGAGKSAIYQVPALLLEGRTVVVSPLIALQHDQIEGLADTAAPEAVALNSTLREGERSQVWEAVREGEAEYLFLSPEQLADDERLDALTELDVDLFVVDEAHCVSGWGHDFRPDYLRLGSVVERLGHPRVIALTATAAPPVRADIAQRLGLRDHREVIASFDRPNLHLSVERFTSDGDKRSALLERVRAWSGRTGLVYVASRRDTDDVADELIRSGVRAAAYHAGMKAADRERVHQDFLAGELDVVVATSAFGMGIDKPDVRFVLHGSVPDSLDAYYQQVGRAGRDGDPAEIILYYRPEDLGLQRFLTSTAAPEDAVREIVAAVTAGPAEGVEPESGARYTRAVNLLEQAGAVALDQGRIRYVTDRSAEQAVADAVEVAENHQRMVRSRLEMMRGYAETTGCRRQFLLGYFGEELADPCGNCDTCDAGTADRQVPGTSDFARDEVVRHQEWGRGVVMSVERDRLTVLFDAVGYKTLSLAAVRENDLLSTPA
jgi:ATP-dependent DNA helicase RecQ